MQKTNLSQSFWRIFSFALIVYVFFILGRSIWINWQLRQNMQKLEAEIENINIEKKNMENLILYYKSDSFKEVEARQKLGLKKPGETVIAVKSKTSQDYATESQKQKQDIAARQSSQEEKSPNWQLWWEYFVK